MTCFVFLTSCEGIMAQDGQGRRYPQNLQGLLQLAVEAGSASEGSGPVELMSEEVNTNV